MNFDWDENKNHDNILKHGFDFEDTWEVFEFPIIEQRDARQDYGEERWIGIGLLRYRVVVVIYTYRGEDTIRIISLRKATSYEQIQYEEFLRNRLGAN